MSAFVVSQHHISYLVRAAIAYNRLGGIDYAGERVTYANAQEVGAGLLAENIASVTYRYAGNCDDTTAGYTFSMFHGPRDLSAVQVLKAIDCYEYQSCEHPGWETSAAHEFCAALRTGAINHLPGYDAAAWEVA